MNRRVHVLVLLIVAAGLAAVGLSVWAHDPVPLPAVWRLMTAVAVLALADVTLVQIRFGHNRHAFTWSEAFVVLGLAVVPEPWLVLLAAPVLITLHLSLRRGPLKALFNAFGLTAGIGLARAAYGIVAGGGAPAFDSARAWAGLGCAALVLSLWSHATVAAVVSVSQRTSWPRVFVRGLPVAAVVLAGNTAVGLGLVALSTYDKRVLILLPVLLGLVLLGYRAYASAQQEADTWQWLQRASRELTQLRRDELAEAVTVSAEALFDAEFVEVLVLDQASRAHVYRRSDGRGRTFRDGPALVAPSFWPRASSERELFQVDARRAPAAQQAELAELGLTSCIAAPLVVTDDCVGMLRVGFRGPIAMTARELQVLGTFANQVATSVCNAQLFEQTTGLFEQNRAVTESLGEGVVAMDAEGLITFANPAAASMAGRTVAELLGMQVHEALHAPGFASSAGPLHGRGEACLLTAALAGGGTVRDDDHAIHRPDGSSMPVALTGSAIRRGHQVAGAVLALRDMTERRALEAQLVYQAFHDPITDVANRSLFLDRLQHAMARRAPSPPAVLFIDVDRFKVVNDSLGHRAGDALLRLVAQRLSDCLRPADTLARWGGDEFTVLLEDLTDDGDPVKVAERVLAAMRSPFPAVGHEVVLSVSVGVAVGRPGLVEPQQLIHDADVAMYRAKEQGRDTLAVFRPDMEDAPLERLELENAVRRGLDNHEFRVHYQPIVSVGSRRLVGVEALVRWSSPQGLLSPAAFISLAEDTGLILPLGRQVLDSACSQVHRWHADHPEADPIGLSVNLSARQFQDPALAQDVADILARSGLAPEHLCLEITESVVMQDVPSTMATLADLKNLGVRLAIDDFGTGYSSLSYLKRFPLDAVKIDRSFIDGLGVEAVDKEIVGAVVRLAASLGVDAVAEGVETEVQLEALREIGCPLVQGYFFSPAQPAEHIEAMIEQQLLGAS